MHKFPVSPVPGFDQIHGMRAQPDHDRDLKLYVLERNVHHLSALLATEQDRLKVGVLQNLLDSARQDLHAFKAACRHADSP